jgi:membrane-bound ClpP family serine protease
MTPVLLIIILFAAGALLLLGELLLPAQGVLGVLGCATILWGIGQAFAVNQWLGFGLMLGTIASIPFVWSFALAVWPRTPIGRRMMLSPAESIVQPPRVGIGQRGVAVSELRPLGMCEFAGERVEARSQLGTIRAGKMVRVVSVDQGRLIVEAIEPSNEEKLS